VQIRATLQNPKRKLLPGMFISLYVDTGKPENYLTLPSTAVTYNPYGTTIFIAVPSKQDDKKSTSNAPAKTDNSNELIAKQVFVTTGSTRGDQVAILSGINRGDTVITSGQLKLKNGTPVIVNNSVLPTNDPNPKPHEE
jgi:membrane fusion protein (multidrug efflux system)